MSLIAVPMDMIILSLGSNKGIRENRLQQAVELLNEAGVEVIRASAIYETEPMGEVHQPFFLNQVIAVKTDLEPEELLELCLQIESQMGRVRGILNGPRVIDIDLLFYGDELRHSTDLQLPHRGITERRFVLQPLLDIAADETHPLEKKSVSTLLDECEDPLIVKPYNLPHDHNQVPTEH